MSNRLKICPLPYSGKLKPHEYTSYLPLVLLLIVVGMALTIFTVTAASPPPQASSIGLSGVVPGKPPTTAATIQTPSSGQNFSTTPVAMSGTCPADTLVEIYKNDIFAGSTPCDKSGNYSLKVDLMIGKNVLVARVYNNLNQAGPDSNKITVYYNALTQQGAPLTNLAFGGKQLLVNTDAVFRGIFPDKQLNVPINIIGGTPPYATDIQWGDATNKIIPRNDNQPFNADHTYTKPGVFQISIQVTDANQRVAFLTVASIVNGQPDAVAAIASGKSGSTTKELLLLWPLYTASIAIAISFWLGEYREKHMLAKRGLFIPS